VAWQRVADCRALVRETALQSSPPILALEVGGEDLFPESAVTRLVGLVISSTWQRVGCLVALLSQRWRWMVPTSTYSNSSDTYSTIGTGVVNILRGASATSGVLSLASIGVA
jgi:hypothetical protein